MKKKKIILRLSNEMGNQLFMYASAYSISKKMNRELFLDNETAFLSKKNISKYALRNFNISSSIIDDKFKFKKLNGYLKRKFLIKSDFLRSKKKFFIEKKDRNKFTHFDDSFINKNYDDIIFLEGHFESPKYFDVYENQIRNEFKFKDELKFKNVSLFKQITRSNSVGICIRQNRFSEGQGKINNFNIQKSQNYVNEQIKYINKSVNLLKSKLNNPIFYIWSNDLNKIDYTKFNFNFNPVNVSKFEEIEDLRALSLFLLSSCNHFITIPSTFSWWGAWLSTNNKKIITRPSEESFSVFRVNNRDFWPHDWIKIT